MSNRIVHTCDICKQDIADSRKMATFYGPVGTLSVDVGPCCREKPVSALVKAYQDRHPSAALAEGLTKALINAGKK